MSGTINTCPAGLISSVKEVLLCINPKAKPPGKLKIPVLPLKWESNVLFFFWLTIKFDLWDSVLKGENKHEYKTSCFP